MKNQFLKRAILFSFCLLTSDFLLLAQAPQGIPYQAIARNASGAAIANTAVKVRFSIRDSIATGAIRYQETHNPTTSALGLFSVNVGMGTVASGTFSGINWGKNAKFLQVELDPAGGSSYTDLGTTQMMSVPYALFAEKSNFSIQSINAPKNRIGFDQNSIWKCPAGITEIEVQLWGAGGGGGGILAWDGFGGVGGTGGKGGYIKGKISVIPGTEYQITVGVGGNRGLYSNGNSVPLSSLNGTDGGFSSFNGMLTANGGKKGTGTARGSGGILLQTGVNGEDGQIQNYENLTLTSRSYIPQGYTNLYPLSFASGGESAAFFSISSIRTATLGESGFCVISY